MSSLTVIILTCNEELHIARCLDSLASLSANILIVDSFSVDKTVEISEEKGAVVLKRSWLNYADQFQFALENNPFKSEWIMRLDADEYLDHSMQLNLISSLRKAPSSISGFRCNLRNIYLGKKIRFGGYDPLNLLRIWRNGLGRIESRWMDEHIVLTYGDTSKAPGEILHNNLNNHRFWTEKHNKYADREMIDILNNKYHFFAIDNQLLSTKTLSVRFKRFLKVYIYNKLPIFVRPSAYFFARYFIFLGFLDGKEGFAYHFFQAYWYRCLVDVRVLEAENLLLHAHTNSERLTALQELTGLSLK
ncbi:MAG: glycosyltransferase family 2 protein [Dehalococcoidales bacterium]